MEFQIKTRKHETGIVISFIGSLDSDTYIEGEKEIMSVLEKSAKVVVLDMKDLSYISSAGLAIIFKVKQTVVANGATLALANLQPNVEKIFKAVKAIPESFFASLEGTDDFLDAYIATIISKDEQKEK